MASFTGVGDNTTLTVPDRGENVTVALSGTYNMVIKFQREQGSPYSGAWVTLETYSTANATVSDTYTTEGYNERLRLIVTTDTSGTCTASLTDATDLTIDTVKDGVGNTLVEWKQSGPTVTGDLTVNGDVAVAGVGGSYGYDVTTITAASDTLTPAEFAGKLVTLDKSGGIDITLPAATGTGHVYTFFILTTTTDAYTFTCAGSDKLYGQAIGADAAAEFIWNAVGGTDTVITLGGTNQETGGTKGDLVQLIDVGSAIWHARIHLEHGSGTEATPFGT